MIAVADFLLGNLWRTGALALGIAISVQHVWLIAVRAERDTYKAEVSVVAAQLDVAATELFNARQSANSWEQTALDLQSRLSQFLSEQQAQRERDEQALAASRRRVLELSAQFKEWQTRHAQALRTPSCQQLMNTPICGTEGQ